MAAEVRAVTDFETRIDSNIHGTKRAGPRTRVDPVACLPDIEPEPVGELLGSPHGQVLLFIEAGVANRLSEVTAGASFEKPAAAHGRQSSQRAKAARGHRAQAGRTALTSASIAVASPVSLTTVRFTRSARSICRPGRSRAISSGQNRTSGS